MKIYKRMLSGKSKEYTVRKTKYGVYYIVLLKNVKNKAK